MTSTAHVLYVQERFPVLSETFVRNEAERLRARGTMVSVVTTRLPVAGWSADVSLNGEPERVPLAGAHLHWLRSSPSCYVAFWLLVLRAPLKDKPFMLLAPAIARRARAAGVTHVHTHFAFRAASVARAVALFLGCRRSVTTHANDLFTRRAELPARLADADVLTISRFNHDYLAALGISSQVNHCGVDVDTLDDMARTTTRRATDVVFVGRLVEKKGPLVLLAALARLQRDTGRRPKTVIVGDGPLRSACERYAADHGLDVRFPGALDATQTLETIASGTVFCLPCQEPSDGDRDGIPVVLIEAMALGAAVISTPVSGIPELVTNETGWLVQGVGEEQVSSLAVVIDDVLDDVAQRRRRAVAARALVGAEFTIDAQADGVLRATDRVGAV